jgi:hypothetical protein
MQYEIYQGRNFTDDELKYFGESCKVRDDASASDENLLEVASTHQAAYESLRTKLPYPWIPICFPLPDWLPKSTMTLTTTDDSDGEKMVMTQVTELDRTTKCNWAQVSEYVAKAVGDKTDELCAGGMNLFGMPDEPDSADTSPDAVKDREQRATMMARLQRHIKAQIINQKLTMVRPMCTGNGDAPVQRIKITITIKFKEWILSISLEF